jgi:hypothetical protein
MSFEISALDSATPAETGFPMFLFKPGTREPVTNELGEPIFIKLRGRLSNSAAAADRAIQLSRLDRQKKQVVLDGDALMAAAEQETVSLLAACTVEWNFDTLDGRPFPYSRENAMKFWGDPRFKSIREQATAFINTDANFLS